MYQYWFINFNKCTTQCKILIIGKTVGRSEGMYENSLLPAQLFYKPATALMH